MSLQATTDRILRAAVERIHDIIAERDRYRKALEAVVDAGPPHARLTRQCLAYDVAKKALE